MNIFYGDLWLSIFFKQIQIWMNNFCFLFYLQNFWGKYSLNPSQIGEDRELLRAQITKIAFIDSITFYTKRFKISKSDPQSTLIEFF